MLLEEASRPKGARPLSPIDSPPHNNGSSAWASSNRHDAQAMH